MNGQWLRGRTGRVFFGLTVGGLVGAAMYQASTLTGRNLFVLAGATAGAVAVIIVQAYSRTARLTGVTLTIPQISEMHFAVTRHSQDVAWKLFVESVTRVATQRLEDGSGLLRETMTSLYGLFNVTRETLKAAEPSVRTTREPTVEHLAIAMLNNEIRPFLSRWHPELKRWEEEHSGRSETEWPRESECRADLLTMQARLRQYVLGFGRLAGFDEQSVSDILTGTLGPAFPGSTGRGAPVPQQGNRGTGTGG